MSTKHISYPKIGQFRDAINSVTREYRFVGLDEEGNPIYDEDRLLPTLKAHGTIKLHGSNASVKYNEIDGLQTQSRNNSFTLDKVDSHMGFTAFVISNKSVWLGLITQLSETYDIDLTTNTITIFMEWIGKGIQKGVAVSELDKMAVIFSRVKVNPMDTELDGYWIPSKISSREHRIYNIDDFKTYEVEIDFNHPSIAADIMSKMVDEVERECPFAKEFGVSGCGEGIVWYIQTDRNEIKFKTKGEEHKGKKGDKKGNKVAIDIERVESINALVDTILDEGRLNQGFDHLRENNNEFSRKSTGIYVNWVYGDVIKEELDTITGNGFEPNDVKGAVCDIARRYFFEKLDSGYGL